VKTKSKPLPAPIRARAIRAGRKAKSALRAIGASPEVCHAAYRIAWNVEAARWRRAFDTGFRERQNAACRRYAARQRKSA
jgi:hypothetical protein